jgi:hypothetical protein
MPEDPTGSMNREIVISGGGYAVVLITMIVLAFGGEPVSRIVVNASSGSFLATLFVALVTAIAFGLGYILVVFNIHYSIDRAVRAFRTKRRVDAQIVQTLLNEAPPGLKERVEGMNPEERVRRELMYVFYEFTDRPDDTWPVLRGTWASHWTPYCVFMIWFGLSCVGILSGVVALAIRGLDWFSGVLLVFSFATFILSFWAARRDRNGFVIKVTAPQLIKITKDNSEAFHRMLNRRFPAR